MGGHGRTLAITLFLQMAGSRRVGRARACPGMPKLTYPSRTRDALSVRKTSNGSSVGSTPPCRLPPGIGSWPAASATGIRTTYDGLEPSAR
jgi:hypothetical protein